MRIIFAAVVLATIAAVPALAQSYSGHEAFRACMADHESRMDEHVRERMEAWRAEHPNAPEEVRHRMRQEIEEHLRREIRDRCAAETHYRPD